MSDAIYVITCFKQETYEDEENYKNRRSRTWGWYHNIEKAEEAILGNWTDMFEEDYYDVALIEKKEEGILSRQTAERWYFADYRGVERAPGYLRNPKIERIAQPKWAEGTIGWGLG